MDPLDYLKVLHRRWRIIAGTLLIALAAAWFTTPAPVDRPSVPIGTSYTATHTLLRAPDDPHPVNLELTRLFATTGEIPRRAAEKLGLPPDQGPILAGRVRVAVDPEVGSLAVTVSGPDGARAAEIANTFAAEIVENLRATLQRDRDADRADARRLVESLGQQVSRLQAEINKSPGEAPLLQAQRDGYLTNYSAAFSRLQALTQQGAARSPLRTLEEATPVPVQTAAVFTAPSSRVGRLTLALLVGLVIGVVLALVVERFDRRLRTRDAVEDVTSLPVVAEVPVLARSARRDFSVSVVRAPGGAVAEAYRSLRSAVMQVPSRPALSAPASDLPWSAPQVLLVTSPLPADGKTTTVANLAACLAESGRQVLVLDCDFRNPRVHRYLDVAPGAGMSDLLAGTGTLRLADVVRPSAVPGVRVVTSGRATDHPAALLARAGGLLQAARQLADVVLIDAAPVLAANDATDLVPYIDAVVLVTRSGKTTQHHALRTAELLARLSVPVAGTVLVASNGQLPGYSSGLSAVLTRSGRWRRRGMGVEPPQEWLVTEAPTAPEAAAAAEVAVPRQSAPSPRHAAPPQPDTTGPSVRPDVAARSQDWILPPVLAALRAEDPAGPAELRPPDDALRPAADPHGTSDEPRGPAQS